MHLDSFRKLWNDPWFEDFCIKLLNDVPREVYLFLSLIYVICFIIIIYKKRKILNTLGFILLMEYILWLFISTIFCREPLKGRNYELIPFWSYNEIESGKLEFLVENILNTVVFIPIGTLAYLLFRNKKWYNIILFGLSISAIIEILQYVFVRGLAEIDDVIHNTLGCFLGYIICLLLVKTWSCFMNCYKLLWGKEKN